MIQIYGALGHRRRQRRGPRNPCFWTPLLLDLVRFNTDRPATAIAAIPASVAERRALAGWPKRR